MRNVIVRTRVSFVMIAVILALSVGLIVAQDVGAKPAKGVSVSDREQAQKDLCWASGGTFESRDYHGSYTNGHQFIKNVTTCTGGENPQTCTNTKSDTTCTKQRFVPSPRFPRDEIMIDESRVDRVKVSPNATAEPVVVDAGPVIEESRDPGTGIEPLEEESEEGKPSDTEKVDGEPVAVEPVVDATPVLTDESVADPATDEVSSEPIGEPQAVDDGSIGDRGPKVNDGDVGGGPATDQASVDSTPFPDGQIT